MNNRLCIAAILIPLVLFSSSNVLSKEKKGDFDWDEITDADWSITQDSAAGIFDAAMVFEKIRSDDTKLDSKKCYYVIYRRIRILNDVGRKHGDVEVPFLSTSQKIEKVEGRTVLPDGNIIYLDEEHIFHKEVIKSKEMKFEQYTFSMPGITDDCIIEYMIKYKTGYNFYNTWIIQKDIPLLKGEYLWKYYTGGNWSVALTMTLIDIDTPNYLWLNCGDEKSVEHLPNIKDATEILFEISNVPAFEEEPYMFPESALKAELICYYGSDVAPAAYWGLRASRIKDSANSFCKKDKRLKKIVEQFNDLATIDEKIEAAYRWVQENIKNLAYDDVFDDKNRKIEPKENEDADDVIKHGYGTNTDINRVFYDMLREMNIDAKIAYAMDRSERILIYEAKYWQFDASMVAVPDEKSGFIFYIPSYKFVIPGTVPWFFEGAQAILGGADVNFAAIPFTGSSFSNVNRIYNLEINGDLEIKGTIDTRFTGHNARRTRIYLEDNDSTEYEKLLQESFEESFENATLDSFRIENYDNIDEPLELACNAEYPDLGIQGGRILLRPFSYFSSSENPFFAQNREKAILFKHSYELRESAQIKIPEGWTMEAVPADTLISNLAGDCGVQFSNFGDILNIQRYFVLKSPFWRVEQYPIVKELFQARNEFSDLIIVLKKEN